ncbi:MAG: molybdopterin-guanine dinucleotide biosynthesis protein B [Planctomycetes bacterium]|nr:molybdopterin-guanine dinucleotide biosynthesis protein B [Planctomycetota bacterium]
MSIVGRSGCGKTTLLERLIPALLARGIEVATLKHHAHAEGADRPGKDTWRHFAAGAARVGLSSPAEVAFFERRAAELPPEDFVRRFFAGTDLVLTEGYKKGPFPKIEVARRALSTELVSTPAEGLIAAAADFDPGAPVPRFPLDDPGPLADFLERTVMAEPNVEAWSVEIRVDGAKIPLNAFVRQAFSGMLEGFLAALKGVPESPGRVEIVLARKSGSRPPGGRTRDVGPDAET